MSDPDKSHQVFQQILEEFKAFTDKKGGVSESDTRVKLIDRIIKEALNWSEPFLSREDHTQGIKAGFTDYQLRIKSTPYIAIEAKREGIDFVLPHSSDRKRLKLSGIIQTSPEVKKTINQVRQYCIDDIPIKYAIATNGYAWIIFKPILAEGSWKDGYATVFYSTDYINENFIQFYNLLSFDSLSDGSLENEFAIISSSERGQYRVKENLFNADLPLARNRLHAQLNPVIETFFLDIAGKEQIEILESCYVHSRSSTNAMKDLDNVILDLIPNYLKIQGTDDLLTGEKDSGQFEKEITGSIQGKESHLYLLLGGIGSGKTTFLKRYLRITGSKIVKNAIPFYIDLLGPPPDFSDFEKYVYSLILATIREKYSSIIKESRKTLKKIFADELSLLHESTLKSEQLTTDEYERRISPYFEKWKSNTSDYVTRLLKLCIKRDKAVLLFIDNVDQLNPEYQSKVFLFAQKITREIGSITILALREESYYATNTQKTLNAYANKKFHIISPRFRRLIENRIDYAIKVLKSSDEEIRLILQSGLVMDKDSIANFLDIIKASIFYTSKQITRFIEAICYGNMRLALDMFNTFMVSGATDVDKMINIFKREGRYNVAVYEFIKSVMLQDKCYYRETNDNPIMNIFDCGVERNSSHLTGLRAISLISSKIGSYSPEGRGFVPLADVIYEFENSFDNRNDLIRTLNRMVWWRLLEVNTKSQETIDGASHIKTTPAGSYYMHMLVKKFAYLDLVLQDTPLNDNKIMYEVTDYMKEVDNLTGKEEDKQARTLVRFKRVDRFLQYLKEEEENDFAKIGKPVNPILGKYFIPDLIEYFEVDKEWIMKRYKQNLEKYKGIAIDEEKDEEDMEIPGLSEVYDNDADDITPSLFK